MITTRPAQTRVRVSFNGEVIAESTAALVLEEGTTRRCTTCRAGT